VGPSRPTILQIIPRLDTGGAELSTIEIADAITRGGGRALVATEGGRMLMRLKDVGADVRLMPLASKNPARLALNAVQLRNLIRAEHVGVVHARSRAPAWSALWAARAARCPFVTTYHGAYNEQSRLKNFYNSVMARGRPIIANSAYTRDLIIARYATPLSAIRVIHRGVDGTIFDPRNVSEERVEKLRLAWGLKPHERALIQAARLTSWKGQSVVIAAARALEQRDWPEAMVVILAGDDQGRQGYRESLEREIADAGLSERVRLVGHVEDIPAALRLAHAAVVASTEPEAFGRSAIEAQAMGCPVIATRIGAPPETVRAAPEFAPHERTGWLVPPSDPSALAQAITAVFALSSAERAELGARARAHVLEMFSLHAMRRKTLAVYDEILASGLEAAYVANTPQPNG
jgi:glycosyltransferase involved in cell wall biosynthesis